MSKRSSVVENSQSSGPPMNRRGFLHRLGLAGVATALTAGVAEVAAVAPAGAQGAGPSGGPYPTIPNAPLTPNCCEITCTTALYHCNYGNPCPGQQGYSCCFHCTGCGYDYYACYNDTCGTYVFCAA